MKITELYESPESVDATQFNLDDVAFNRQFAANKVPKAVEVIEDTAEYKMLRTGDGNAGWIFLYNLGRKTVDYVIQYKTRYWKWLDSKSVTQCVLWRDDASPLVRNATTRMFFGYLLRNYSTIISDRLQTDQGHRFWVSRMADAVTRNYPVGVADLNRQKVNWFVPAVDGDFQDWIRLQQAFGKGEKYQALRYVIKD
jgi:hypothetical protein